MCIRDRVERPFLFEAEMAEAEVLGGAQGISVVDKFCHAGEMCIRDRDSTA